MSKQRVFYGPASGQPTKSPTKKGKGSSVYSSAGNTQKVYPAAGCACGGKKN